MIDVYVKERNEAFLSLDKKRIERFCRKWHLCLPSNDTVFWCGVHKVIANIESAPKEKKENSIKWLEEHGFSPEIFK